MSRTDATAHVTTSLRDYADQHDIDAIVDAIHAENGGSWDFTDFDEARFWEIVEANAL